MRCRWQNDGVVYSALYMFLSMPLSKNQFDAKEKLCSTNTMFITSFSHERELYFQFYYSI
jgi:hypothetical protein